jgi:HPt (histidine-containing phosphotransfer) domain-containing protein
MSGLASARLQKLERLCFRLAQQFRQLGKNGRDALRLVAREQFASLEGVATSR